MPRPRYRKSVRCVETGRDLLDLWRQLQRLLDEQRQLQQRVDVRLRRVLA